MNFELAIGWLLLRKLVSNWAADKIQQNFSCSSADCDYTWEDQNQTTRYGSKLLPVTREKTMVVMVRTLGSFFVAKKDRWEISAKKVRWEFWGRFSCQSSQASPAAPTGFNRCLGEVSSHHGRGQVAPAAAGGKEWKSFCGVTSRLLWCSGWGCGSCGTTLASLQNYNSNLPPAPARGIITPSASSENSNLPPEL